MENTRVFFRSFDAASAIQHFSGFLPMVLEGEALKAVCSLQAGIPLTDATLIAKLVEHKVIVERDGAYFSKVPLLTTKLAEEIHKAINKELPNMGAIGEEEIRKIAKNDPELWKTTGHVIASQLILGLLWYKLWQNLADDPHDPAAVIVPDFDLNKAFLPGIYPLYGNQSISYWQSPLLGHPDTIHDILHHKNVYKSLQTANDRGEFVPIDTALVLLKKLNMYKNRTGENSLPVPYVTLPIIDKSFVSLNKDHLHKLADLFYNMTNQLTAVSKKLYADRCTAMQEVDYDYFRQMVYLVFCHQMVIAWQGADLLPDANQVRDYKKTSKAPQWKLARE